MSNTTAGSASSICNQPERFENWAYEVSAQWPPLSGIPPGPVEEMVRNSRCVPGWLWDKESSYFKLQSSLSGQQMNEIFDLPPEAVSAGEPHDTSAARDLALALHHIFYLRKRHAQLEIESHHKDIHSESDFRQPLDRLASHMWCTEVGPEQGYLFRSECTVKLPKTKIVPIANATVDSMLFLFNRNDTYTYLITAIDPKIRQGLLCTVHEVQSLELVHWVLEYKKTEGLAVQRQIYYGLVSSLWQRRALGRMGDFVFGLAQSKHHVTVYAARWEKGSLQNPRETDKSPVDLTASLDNLSLSTRKSSQTPGQSLSGLSLSRSNQSNKRAPKVKPSAANLQQEEKQYKIVVYEIASYQTTKLTSMIHLYLLMRESQNLAQQYQNEILRTSPAKLELEVEKVGLYNWAFPQRRGGSTTQSELPSIDEDPGPSGTQRAILMLDPREERGWEESCRRWYDAREKAWNKYGYGSLEGFRIPEREIENDWEDGSM